MLEVTSDDIVKLNDADLRTLVAYLCESEVDKLGQSQTAVTWGGDQTAPDGGLDVRVSLLQGFEQHNIFSRAETGIQVKKSNMPRNKLIKEMRPNGAIRPAIQDLANANGCYIIVSSSSNVSDSALKSRKDAMREALDDVDNADQLDIDFFDSNRIATWVQSHGSLSIWVKEKIGSPIKGWRGYGSWSGSASAATDKYIEDDEPRVKFLASNKPDALSVTGAIDQIRNDLREPKKIIRFVGLSGVGKTRFMQVLFDDKVGNCALPERLAVYTDLSDNPNSSPKDLAREFVGNGTQAILIIDNCPHETHTKVSEICNNEMSKLSLVTIEHDIRDNQPENTNVIKLEPSSSTLIEGLVCQNCPHVSNVDAQTIADVSKGNARLALLLANGLKHKENLSILRCETLFERLFHQNNQLSEELLQVAQVCSLVYSFDGETRDGDTAELPRLAELAMIDIRKFERYVATLCSRDIAQKRGKWRAILPQALANRLATWALDKNRFDDIHEQLITNSPIRLAISFTRRLSFLHDHLAAIDNCTKWLAPNGMLGDVATLDEQQAEMFKNIASVVPDKALLALERVGKVDPQSAAVVTHRYRYLIRSLAYDQSMFNRCIALLVSAAHDNPNKHQVDEIFSTFASLFNIYLSGTHATIEQRIQVIKELLIAKDEKSNELGFSALKSVLQTRNFSSSYSFEFGAQSRDYGYHPQTSADYQQWYNASLDFIKDFANSHPHHKEQIRSLFATEFKDLWVRAQTYDTLENLQRNLAGNGFWPAGWNACCEARYFDKSEHSSESYTRLSALIEETKPATLVEQVHAYVIENDKYQLFDTKTYEKASHGLRRLENKAIELGKSVALDNDAFTELLPDIFRSDVQLYHFGKGLATASNDKPATWNRLVKGLEQTSIDEPNMRIFRGFLASLAENEKDVAHNILDQAQTDLTLQPHLLYLESSMDIDARSVVRLQNNLQANPGSIQQYSLLACGGVTDSLSAELLADLLRTIADQPGGAHISLDILAMKFHDQSDYDPVLLDIGREILPKICFEKIDEFERHSLANIIEICLKGTKAQQQTATFTTRMQKAINDYWIQPYEFSKILEALLMVQPEIVLDILLEGDASNAHNSLLNRFNPDGDSRANPFDVVPHETLLSWCAQDPKNRYPFAASIITFAVRSEKGFGKAWSEQAIALLGAAPNLETVIKELTKRFIPMIWSGSHALAIEENIKLLDSLSQHINHERIPCLANIKAGMASTIQTIRDQDAARDSQDREGFE